jgi:hypothetical protein
MAGPSWGAKRIWQIEGIQASSLQKTTNLLHPTTTVIMALKLAA